MFSPIVFLLNFENIDSKLFFKDDEAYLFIGQIYLSEFFAESVRLMDSN